MHVRSLRCVCKRNPSPNKRRRERTQSEHWALPGNWQYPELSRRPVLPPSGRTDCGPGGRTIPITMALVGVRLARCCRTSRRFDPINRGHHPEVRRAVPVRCGLRSGEAEVGGQSELG
jgi:hypothetical protein